MSGRRRVGLASARRAAGYTQEQLAEQIGVQRETVVRWEDGRHAPSPYLRPKLARILGRSRRELEGLIDPRPARDQVPELAITPGIYAACRWLDERAGWQLDTAYERLASALQKMNPAEVRARDGYRGATTRSRIVTALGDYYTGDTPRYWAEYSELRLELAIAANRDWLELDLPLTPDTDLFSLTGPAPDPIRLDAAAAKQALRRLVEAVVLDVAIVNMPLYRFVRLSVEGERVGGLVSTVPFVEYALTSDLLETELVDQLVGSTWTNTARLDLPMRDRYLPDVSSVFDISRRTCCGGVLALCAIARPADRHRGADYLLLTQERGRRVVNGVGRLSVIPRGFHQPLTDFRADASIGSTLRRELEEELFRRVDVDNTLSEGRIADPMHPNRLSESMRWLLADPGRVRFEVTGFGFNLLNGNLECTCLVLIEDPEFWVRYGDQIEANWESTGLRQFSSRDRQGIRDLIQDEAWSNEGLFAFMQGLKRLSRIEGGRVDLADIGVGVTGEGC